MRRAHAFHCLGFFRCVSTRSFTYTLNHLYHRTGVPIKSHRRPASAHPSQAGRQCDAIRRPDGSIRFWRHDLHPIWLRTPAVIDQKLDYIHMNPVNEGFVDEPQHYPYSSAAAYAGMPSMLSVEII